MYTKVNSNMKLKALTLGMLLLISGTSNCFALDKKEVLSVNNSKMTVFEKDRQENLKQWQQRYLLEQQKKSNFAMKNTSNLSTSKDLVKKESVDKQVFVQEFVQKEGLKFDNTLNSQFYLDLKEHLELSKIPVLSLWNDYKAGQLCAKQAEQLIEEGKRQEAQYIKSMAENFIMKTQAQVLSMALGTYGLGLAPLQWVFNNKNSSEFDELSNYRKGQVLLGFSESELRVRAKLKMDWNPLDNR